MYINTVHFFSKPWGGGENNPVRSSVSDQCYFYAKYDKRRIKLHIFSKFSRRVACPLACVQLISLFLFQKNHFFIQNAIKIYTKTQEL